MCVCVTERVWVTETGQCLLMTAYVVGCRMKSGYEVLVTLYWRSKPEDLGQQLVTVTRCHKFIGLESNQIVVVSDISLVRNVFISAPPPPCVCAAYNFTWHLSSVSFKILYLEWIRKKFLLEKILKRNIRQISFTVTTWIPIFKEIEFVSCNCLEVLHICQQTAEEKKNRGKHEGLILWWSVLSRINRTETEMKTPFIYYKYFLKYRQAFRACWNERCAPSVL